MPKSSLTRGLRDQIAVELRGDIVAGRFAPGVQMVERQLAQRFGVSHAPIREALLQLSHEGLLISQTNRGAQVAPMLEPAIRRFFMAIRMSLESYALRLSFDELTEADLADWDEMVRSLDEARRNQQGAAISELDFNFHQSIVCRAGQPDVVAAWRTVVARARVYAGEWLGTLEQTAGEHADHGLLVTHCRAKSVVEAVRVLENNIRAEMESIRDASDPLASLLMADQPIPVSPS